MNVIDPTFWPYLFEKVFAIKSIGHYKWDFTTSESSVFWSTPDGLQSCLPFLKSIMVGTPLT